jgi:uncharacterized protein YhbP (UPF0306 family)
VTSAEAAADPGERRDQALAYLARHTVLSLATHGSQGVWSTAVFYASNGFDLYFLSAGHTRHGQNLKDNSRAAATIQENYTDWPAIQGVQMEGVVALLSGEEREAAIAHFMAKFSFLAGAGQGLQEQLARISWYRLRPDRLYFVDNSLGFGHRDEIDLPAAGDWSG